MMYLYEKLVPKKESQTAAAAAAEQPKQQQPQQQKQPARTSNHNNNTYDRSESNVVKTLHFVLDALFAGFPDVYRKIRDQLNEQEVQVYGRRLRPST
jgi:hypothetical protein